VSSRRGTVLGRDGAAIRVLAGSDELRAVLRGRMKQQGLKVVAGDVVTLEPEAGGDLWGIIEVEPRRSVLERRIPGGRGTRAIAANIDRIFVVSASREPAPVPSVIDRLLVLAEANDVTPALVVNKMARRLAREEGILVGGSAGLNVAVALDIARELDDPDAYVVTILCDTGERYLSKVFNDDWMQENQLLDRPQATVEQLLLQRRPSSARRRTPSRPSGRCGSTSSARGPAAMRRRTRR